MEKFTNSIFQKISAKLFFTLIILSFTLFTSGQENPIIEFECKDQNSREFIDNFNKQKKDFNQISRSNSNEIISLPVIVHLIGFPNNQSTLHEDGIARYFSVINSYFYEIGLRLYLVEIRYMENTLGSNLNSIYQYLDTTAYNLAVIYNSGPSGGRNNLLSFLGESHLTALNWSFSRIPVHELGHTYGLRHTFAGTELGNHTQYSENVARTGPQANCDTTGDGICDTPADNHSSPDDVDIYGVPYSPDYANIMSYYGGMNTFTPQQYDVMRVGFESGLNNTTYTIAGGTYTYDLDAYVQTEIPEAPVFNTLESTHLDNRMSWSPSNNSMGYIVERSEISATTGFAAVAMSGVSENKTVFIDRNIEANKTYWYRVIPVNSKDAYSNVLEINSVDQLYCPVNNFSSCGVVTGTHYYPKRVIISNNGNTILNTTDINCDTNIALNDFSNVSLEPNKEYLINLDLHSRVKGYYNIFCDVNRDGDFEDEDEWLVQNVFLEKFTDLETTFTLPSNLFENGTSLMRMTFSGATVSNACQVPRTISSTQDYIINLFNNEETLDNVSIAELDCCGSYEVTGLDQDLPEGYEIFYYINDEFQGPLTKYISVQENGEYNLSMKLVNLNSSEPIVSSERTLITGVVDCFSEFNCEETLNNVSITELDCCGSYKVTGLDQDLPEGYEIFYYINNEFQGPLTEYVSFPENGEYNILLELVNLNELEPNVCAQKNQMLTINCHCEEILTNISITELDCCGGYEVSGLDQDMPEGYQIFYYINDEFHGPLTEYVSFPENGEYNILLELVDLKEVVPHICAQNTQILNVNCFNSAERINIAEKTNDNVILVYPNPSKNKIKISSIKQIREIQIFSIVGLNLISKKMRNNKLVEVSTENLPTGTYFIKVIFSDSTFKIRKVIKNNK